MELKKPHPSRLVGGHRCRTGWSHTHMWWIKIQEGYLGSEESQTRTSPLSPGFQYQVDKSPQLLAAKTSGVELVEKTSRALSSSSWRTHTQTHSLWAPVPGRWLEGHQCHVGGSWGVWHHGEQRPLSLFWVIPPQSQQTSVVSKIPSTRLTPVDQP